MIRSRPHLLGFCLSFMVALAVTGCDSKETILDVETPDGGIQIERDEDNGDVSVEVHND